MLSEDRLVSHIYLINLSFPAEIDSVHLLDLAITLSKSDFMLPY